VEKRGNSVLAVLEVQVSPGLTMVRPTFKASPVPADLRVNVEKRGNSVLAVLEVQVSPGLTMVRPTFKASPVPADLGVNVEKRGNSVLAVQRLQAKARPKFKADQADLAMIAKVRANQRSVMTTQICRSAQSIRAYLGQSSC
jgi:hypothetical protein